MTARPAIVLKSEKNSIIVLTANGEFRSVKWRYPLPRPGEEVVLREPALPQRQLLAVALAAAFLLVAVLPSVAWALKPAAYIALDINPSIGLEVARSGRIKSGEAYDDAGKMLLQQVTVKGLRPPEAVEKLVQQAAEEGFVTSSADDVIVISQVNLQGALLASLPPLAELEAAAGRGLAAAGKAAFVAVEEASREELQEARQQSTSLNTVRLLKKLGDSDIRFQETPSNKSQPKEKITKESLKKILSDSGKKAAEVFQKGSLKGKPEKASDKKGDPKGKPPWTDKADSKNTTEKRPDNRKPSPAKPEGKKPEPHKPDVNKPKTEKRPDGKKDNKDKPLIKPPGQDKKDRWPLDPKNGKDKPTQSKSEKNSRQSWPKEMTPQGQGHGSSGRMLPLKSIWQGRPDI